MAKAKGIAKQIAVKSRTIPRPPRPWRKLSKLERSRAKESRAYWRRLNETEKYGKFGQWVRAIRNRLGVTQREFARQVGVSTLSIRRWELAFGYWPKQLNIERLEQLDKFSLDMKKQGVKIAKKR